MSMFGLSASLANSSGVSAATPFNVTSGGSKQTTLIIVALAVVALVGLVLWFKK